MGKRGKRSKNVRRDSSQPAFDLNWGALLVLPVILAAVLAGLLFGLPVLDRPISQLVIEGPFQRVTEVQVQAATAPELGPGFLTVDLERMRQRVESLDWIDTAQIRRLWPDKLAVTVTEHRAVARWDDKGLLNVRGEVFAANARHTFPELPRFIGPPGSEREVVAFYLSSRGRLAEANLMLDSLHMNARGAFTFVLAGGQEIRFGRRDIERQLETFFDIAAPALAERLEEVGYVDLRYANGFVVGWRTGTELANTVESYGNG